MLETAEAIVNADESIEPFILSLFPEADQHQITMLKLFLVGFALDNQEIGRLLERYSATDDLAHPTEETSASETQELPHIVEDHIILMKGFCAYHQPSK